MLYNVYIPKENNMKQERSDAVMNEMRCSELTFKEEKAIGVLSFLCALADNKLNHYKAAKLMYLFDREVLLETGEPAFFGKHFSLHAGPIVSEVNNAIKSCLPDELDTDYNWKEYFQLDQDRHQLSQLDPNACLFSGVLSDEERMRLIKLYSRYKDFDFQAMKDVMHSLPENIELSDGERRRPLSYRHILEKNGFNPVQIDEILSEITYEDCFNTVVNQFS